MRGMLAALDHNFHCGRLQAKTANGRLRYARKWIRRSKRWTAVPVLVPKTYAYVPQLLASMLQFYATGTASIRRRSSLREDDPRKLAHTIAALPPMPTAMLVDEHVSRYQ